MGNKNAKLPDDDENEPEAPVGMPGESDLSWDNVLSQVKEMDATQEQLDFYMQWYERAFVPASKAINHAVEVHFSADGRYFEHTISAPAVFILDIAHNYAIRIGEKDESDGDLSGLNLAIRAQRGQLWCQLKHLGTEDSNHDAGVTLLQPLGGELVLLDVDVLIPPCTDFEVLLEYATEVGYKPVSIGMSVLRNAHLTKIGFQPPGYEKEFLLAAFLFFKELGFAKPDEEGMLFMSECEPRLFEIHAFANRKGLVRMGIDVQQPRYRIYDSIDDALTRKPSVKAVEASTKRFDNEPDAFQFFVDRTGYGIALSYSYDEVHQGGKKLRQQKKYSLM